MLSKPTASELRAMNVIRHRQEWLEVSSFLQKELDKSVEMLIESGDDYALRQLQGRSKLIKEFLSLVDNSQVLLEKVERKK